MSLRTRVLAALAIVSGVGIVVACGSDAGESDFGSSSGASGSSGATGSSSGGFGSSGTTSSGGASGPDANPANCKAPVDMFIAFDDSGSMGNDCQIGSGGTSKWCRGITALSGYLKSQGSKDHAAALQFFPLDGHQEAQCTTGDAYHLAKFPATGWETLPSSNFDAVLNTAAPVDFFGTPTEAAIRGLTRFTDANRRGGRVTIGILITDGNPNGCNEDLQDLANLLKAHNTATKVRTYVIGMTGADFDNLEEIAKGGGAPTHGNTVGTLTNACGNVSEPCTFWNVGNGEPAAFEAALAAIQQQADGCNPDGGGFINPVN
jgi:hypothetical protein